MVLDVTSGPDPVIFERGVDLVAVIYSITKFLFSNEIIEPCLLENRGLKPSEPSSGSGPELVWVSIRLSYKLIFLLDTIHTLRSGRQ